MFNRRRNNLTWQGTAVTCGCMIALIAGLRVIVSSGQSSSRVRLRSMPTAAARRGEAKVELRPGSLVQCPAGKRADKLPRSSFRQSLDDAMHASDLTEREKVYSTTVARWTAAKPDEIEGVAEEIEPESKETTLRLTAHLKAERDLATAYQWARSLDDLSLRDVALASILYQAGLDAPRETIELAREAPLGEIRNIVLKSLVLEWAENDFASAEAWTMTQPADEWRDRLFEQLAISRARVEPAAAAQLILVGISPGQVQEEAVIAILRGWPVEGLRDAAAWVYVLPAGQLRERGTQEIRRLALKGS